MTNKQGPEDYYGKNSGCAMMDREHYGLSLRKLPFAFYRLFDRIIGKRSLRRKQYPPEITKDLMPTNRAIKSIDYHGTTTYWIRNVLSFKALRFYVGFFIFTALSLFITPSVSFTAPHADDADRIAYRSAYVWRTDDMGDFVLPVIAEKMEYVSQPLQVDGVIHSMTATWKATGPVALSVSADSGLHYTPVVNGQPLRTGFTKGSMLKWKAVLGAETALLEVSITYADSSGVAGGFGEPELSGFERRKKFMVSNPSGQTLYNYQVVVKVGESKGSKNADVQCEGGILNDFNDVRFTLPDADTLLSYTLERIEGKKPARTAFYFVRVPQIPKEGIILYIYYGKALARSLSSPKDTFDFYEDFSSLKSLDEQKWSATLDTGGSVKVGPEGLLLDAATLTAKGFEFKDGVLELVADLETGYEARIIARDPDPKSSSDASLIAYASGLQGAEHCLVVGNIVKANDTKPVQPGTYYGFRLAADNKDLLTFERFDESFSEKQAIVSYQDKDVPAKGYLALKTTGPGLGRSLTKFRWIRARKLVLPEPSVDPAKTGDEEVPSLPIYKQMTLDGKKDLAISPDAQAGQYITPDIKSDYDIRIIVPEWNGKGASIDISADGGKSYKKNCEDGSYYYAGKGDFAKGKVLRGRVYMEKKEDQASSVEDLAFSYRPGSITLLEPKEGRSVAAGAPFIVKWTAWDYDPSYFMKLDYSLDAGKTYLPVSDAVKNTGTFFWPVPNANSSQALVRISDPLDPDVYDISSGVFSISAVTSVGKAGTAEGVSQEAAVPDADAVIVPAEASAEGLTEQQRKEEQKRKKMDRIRRGAKPYELLVKKLPSGPFEEGDIIMIKPAGFLWGASERNNFLIVQAYLTENEVEEFMRPQEASGAAGRDGQRKIIKQRKYKIDINKKDAVLDSSEIVDKSVKVSKRASR